MESYAEAVGMMEKSDVGSDNAGSSSHSPSIDFPRVPLFDRLLFFLKAIVEYAFGVHIGIAAGWLFGWYAGNVYVEHFEPVYFSDLNELRLWKLMPYDFARNGAVIGVVAGAIAIAIINSKLLSRRVASFYEKEVTDPKDIARALGKSKRRIQKAIKNLAKKQRIVCKKVNVPERLPPRLANTY